MIILLISHIIIAVSTPLYTVYIFFRPSDKALTISYVLLGLTIASGTTLVILKPVNMTRTCVEGLVYMAVILAGVYAVKHKLATQKI